MSDVFFRNLEIPAPDRHLLVLTAPGGLQEETTALGVPCVTIRENTERPSMVEVGTNYLAGTRPEAMFTLFRRLIRREKWYQAHRSHFYQRMTGLGMTLHPGRSCGADRIGGFRGRGDRLRRSMGVGQGTAEQGRS